MEIEMNNYDIVVQDVQSVAPTFISLLGDSGARVFEAEAGFAIQILTGNDYAMKIAAGNRRSVIDAVTNVAAIGISLNPAKKQAYLVPRDGKICLDISYMGLLDMAVEAGVVQWGQCRIVRERDDFALNGIDRQPQRLEQDLAVAGGVAGPPGAGVRQWTVPSEVTA